MPNPTAELDLDPNRPLNLRSREGYSSLGIRKPVNLPEMVTAIGTYIYVSDKGYALRLQNIYVEFPSL